MLPTIFSGLLTFLCFHWGFSLETYRMDRKCSSRLQIYKKAPIVIGFQDNAKRQADLEDCTVIVSPAYNDAYTRVQFFFTEIRIPDCNGSGLDVLEEGNSHEDLDWTLCGDNAKSVLNRTFTSEGPLSIRMNWDMNFSQHQQNSFMLVLTSYTIGRCLPSDVKCNNTRCIHRNLQCSGLNPCGDHSDCFILVDNGRPPSWFVCIVITLGGLVILLLCIGCCKESGADIIFCVLECLRLTFSGIRRTFWAIKWLIFKTVSSVREGMVNCRKQAAQARFCWRNTDVTITCSARVTPSAGMTSQTTGTQTSPPVSPGDDDSESSSGSTDDDDDGGDDDDDSSSDSSESCLYGNTCYSDEFNTPPTFSPPSYHDVASSGVVMTTVGPPIYVETASDGSDSSYRTTERSNSPPSYDVVIENYEMYSVLDETSQAA